ncbi:HD-GYP domain-containing protein [Dongia sp.]|uniref:HD-GYP domain-containing protein n=1 Tax=Dongia sp. TaxID=1977262 RepID=UPI0035B3B848
MLSDHHLPTAIACLTRAEACRDSKTNLHERRVAHIVYMLARETGLDTDAASDIARACLLHDIGKLAVPLELLQKPSSLSTEEILRLKTHSALGHAILAERADRPVQLAATIALHHHERFDGTGYPAGLSGDDIPLPAQIVSICDVYDALREDRPYRPGMSHQAAMRVIVNGDRRTQPAHFGPRVWQGFQAVSEDARHLFASVPPAELAVRPRAGQARSL